MSDFKKLTAYEPCGVEYVSVGGTSYIEQLKAENAKLRQQLEDVTVSMGRVEERCAKLRELAQRADRLLTDLFPHIDYSRCTALEAVAAWRVRARELGVEVPE